MKVMAVICEYNPFHNGHAYQLKKQKEALSCDAVLCLMSGHFVQRGEPAICDKWARAKMALCDGADLVLELPAVYSLSSAEGFAQGAVSLLSALGMNGYLAFGSETADIKKLSSVAELSQKPQFEEEIRRHLATGASYPQAYSIAAASLLDEDVVAVLDNPNDVLGVEYLRALKRTGTTLKPAVLKREKGQHDARKADGEFLSATGIRERLLKGEDVSAFMPPAAYEILMDVCKKEQAPISPEALSMLLCYAIRQKTADELKQISGISEGMEMRLKQAAESCRSFSDMVSFVKTKRYTQTRIQRVMMKTLLGITKEDEALKPAYARVLGIGNKGRELLRVLNEKANIPVITKVADASFGEKEAQRLFALDLAATDLFTLLYPNPAAGKNGQDFYQSPVML